MLMQFVLLIYLGKKRKMSRVTNFEVTNWRFWRCRVRQAFCCYEIASILAFSHGLLRLVTQSFLSLALRDVENVLGGYYFPTFVVFFQHT